MEKYLMFIVIAGLTIASPGPGVILTISNSIQKGILRSLLGIVGIAVGMLVISTISATSIGIIIAESSLAFIVLKSVGAMYLIYMGVTMWKSKVFLPSTDRKEQSGISCFLDAFLLTLLNPKPILFFVAIFPQFIGAGSNHAIELFILTVTFSFLVIVIHIVYAFLASRARFVLSESTRKSVFNKMSGSLFVCFGLSLATLNR